MRRLNQITLILLFTALVLGGCSTIKRYRAELPQNLEISSRTEAVEATVDIYSINSQCKTAYLGTVALDNNLIELGIATGRPSYLVVGFASASFWGNSSGYISYDVTLLPREAYRYEIEITYIDDIYRVVVYEINKKTGEKREMSDKELNACH